MSDMDHFVPFSLYPRDLAANFVLAHSACNRSKSDTLAARPHLDRWVERLIVKNDQLAEIGQVVGLPGDGATIQRVAKWGYSSAVASGGRAWLAARRYTSVDLGYLTVISP